MMSRVFQSFDGELQSLIHFLNNFSIIPQKLFAFFSVCDKQWEKCDDLMGVNGSLVEFSR